jgi:hypothetical protein
MSRFVFLLAAACVTGFAGTASAVPKVGDVTPDSLPFGTLYTGSLAEGSFMLFAPSTDQDLVLKINAPRFVKVLNTEAGAIHQNDKRFTTLTIEVALDTSQAGELKGEIVVTAWETTAKVPVSATVKPRKTGAPRVLVLGSPFHRDSTEKGSFFKGWTDAVNAAGLDASYILIHGKKSVVRDIDLDKFDTVLVSDAAAFVNQNDAKRMQALFVNLKAEDVKRVRAFAEKGGLVVLIANVFAAGSVKGANAILDGYGLELKDVKRPNPGEEVVVKKKHIDVDLVTAGIEKVRFFWASPVKADKEKGGRVLIGAAEFEQAEYGYVGVTKAGKGTVAAMSEWSLWSWVSEQQAKESDNAKVLGYLLAPPGKKSSN